MQSTDEYNLKKFSVELDNFACQLHKTISFSWTIESRVDKAINDLEAHVSSSAINNQTIEHCIGVTGTIKFNNQNQSFHYRLYGESLIHRSEWMVRGWHMVAEKINYNELLERGKHHMTYALRAPQITYCNFLFENLTVGYADWEQSIDILYLTTRYPTLTE